MAVSAWIGNNRLLIAAIPIALVAVTALAIRQLRRARRSALVRRLRLAHPADPWLWDHPWDERGAADHDTARQAAHLVLWGVALSVFAASFSVFGVTVLIDAEGSRRLIGLPFIAIGLVVGRVAFPLLADGTRVTARRLAHGPGVAMFGGFPFRRGETLQLFVEAPQTLPRHAVATAIVRCIQERYVTTGTAEDSTSLHCFEVYQDTAAAELVDAAGGLRALRVTFPIPRDAPSTDLTSHPCRYWEVDLEARTDGVDYAARFLVPVY